MISHNASARPLEHVYESNKNHLLTINIHNTYIPQYILPHHLLTIIAYKSGGYVNTYQVIGAAEKTRTSTGLTPQRPQRINIKIILSIT